MIVGWWHCAACHHMVLVFATAHLYNIYSFVSVHFRGIPFFNLGIDKSDGKVVSTKLSQSLVIISVCLSVCLNKDNTEILKGLTPKIGVRCLCMQVWLCICVRVQLEFF